MIDQFKNADGVGLPCKLSHATRAYDHMLPVSPPEDEALAENSTRERMDSYHSDASGVGKVRYAIT
jgi:hypothetical protein